ncbi:GNAT family N-acetyltransferase [Nonomuraea sp. NPDC046802]|uniref:GNAT family N-acetyltransferase n=1 Tax=Nonomuraea sp. NPDC046802 TaxID=3154919 RepID=UPI0033D2E6BC
MLSRDVISTGSLILRPPGAGDVEAITAACGDPVIARFLPLLPSPYEASDARACLARAEDRWREGGAEFAITENGRWIGSVGVLPPDRWGTAEIGYLVAPWARGRNVAGEAVRAVCDWAFDQGVRRLELHSELENVASLRVAYKAGFHEEGRRREAKRLRDGRHADFVLFGRLAGDTVGDTGPYLPPFEGGQLSDGVVRLSPMTVADAADYLRMLNEPTVAAYSMAPAGTLEDAERRCRHTGYWWVSGQRIELAIREAVSGAFAGHIQLTQVAPVLGQAMVGYSLLAAYRGKGLMTRAVRLLVDWAFANTVLHRIVAGTNVDNAASQAVLERTGFLMEGVHREMLPRPDGKRTDDMLWARVRPS